MIVLRLLREDARNWWYHSQLRKQGQKEEAKKRENASIRSTIKLMRIAKIDELNFRRGWITFLRPEGDVTSWTTSISNVHTGQMAAWIYLYSKGMF